MQNTAILQPFLAMMWLTMIVWVLMYVKRIGYLRAQRVPPQKLTTPDQVAAVIPESEQLPAYNLRNLFELPVLFYFVCLYLVVTDTSDSLYVVLAWVYVALRALHSLIHCTGNIVTRRFLVYMASSLVLWFMLLRASLQLAGQVA
jgi:hypothetical protein